LVSANTWVLLPTSVVDAFEVPAVDVSACAKPAINAAVMIRAALDLLNFMGSSKGFVSGEHLTRSQILSK